MEAAEAYRRAAAADLLFIKPHVHLAAMAVAAANWEEAAAEGGRAVDLNAIEFPVAYLYHALGCLNLKRWKEAELSAAKFIVFDSDHKYPVAEYVLGQALDASGDSKAALSHFRSFVALSPQIPTNAGVWQRIQQLEAAPHVP
jgi:tetratricopeptide (TPR) repeat protein